MRIRFCGIDVSERDQELEIESRDYWRSEAQPLAAHWAFRPVCNLTKTLRFTG
ncbi:MAG: hypothetical protein KME09_00015 [Pleurocapsa minor HA4230-MV1]|nr:hypothetical protein [Pleurocapsa minor HA4230-MV1]